MPARELKLVLDQTRRPARSPARPPRFVDGVEGAPFEQGFALAAQVRAQLGLDGPVDPEALLKRWGVRVFTADLRLSRNIDALAMWKGSSAWVVVNGAGHHAQSRVGRRATLAHEICHVLFDSGGALPLVEALGGRMPRDLEQRARAFAAELLLPRGLIADQYDGDALATVRRAANRFGVSKELAAWQLRNSGVELDAVQRKALKGLVSRPQQF
jgi:Zn-dependent peptidase ImmA (M78 family)